MAYVPYEGYKSAATEITDRLQDTLLKQAALKRQKMMDDIEGQYKTAQMKEMQSQADYRSQQAQMEQQKFNMLRAGNLQPGPVTPDQAQLAESAYPGSTSTTPAQPEVNPQPGQQGFGVLQPQEAKPATVMFRGDPAYMKQQRVAKQLQDMSSAPEWGQMSPDQKMMKVMQSGIDPRELGPYERILSAEPNQPVLVFDQNTGQISYAKGPDGKPIMGKPGERFTRSRLPVPPSEHETFQQINTGDPNMPVIQVGNRGTYKDPTSGKPFQPTKELLAHLSRIGTPGNAQKQIPTIDPATEAQLRVTQKDVDTSDTSPWYTLGLGDSTPDAAKLQAHHRVVAKALNDLSAKASASHQPDQDMNRAWQHMAGDSSTYKQSSSDLAALAVMNKWIPAEKEQDFADYLALARGK